MSNCLTVDDINSLPSCCNILNSVCCPGGNEAIQAELDCACEFILNLLGQKYCPYEDCKLFDGSGHCKLYLDCDIQEIESIEIIGCKESCECKNPCDSEPEMPCISGSMLEYRCAGKFPCGVKNIKICGLWGTEMPAIVKKAIILFTLEQINPGVTGLEACSDVESIAWDDFKITRSVSKDSDNGFTTGYKKLDDMIRPYINPESQLFMGTTSDCDCKKDNCRSCNA